MTVHNGHIGRINLHKQDNRSFIPQIILEASLHFLPFMHADPIDPSPTDKHQHGNAHHIVAGKIRVWFIGVDCYLVEIGVDHFTPVFDDVVVAADEDVEWVQLHHLLQADYYDVGLVDREGEQLLFVSLG